MWWRNHTRYAIGTCFHDHSRYAVFLCAPQVPGNMLPRVVPTCCTPPWDHRVADPTNIHTRSTYTSARARRVHEPGPWVGLTDAAGPGGCARPQTQPLLSPRAPSRCPAKGPPRPQCHRGAPGRPGAAAVALDPPSPPGGRVPSPPMAPATRTRAGTAVRSGGQPFGRLRCPPRSACPTRAHRMPAQEAARDRAEQGGERARARAHLPARHDLRVPFVLGAKSFSQRRRRWRCS